MTDQFDIDSRKGFNPSGDDPLEELRELVQHHPFVADLDPDFRSFEDGQLRAMFPHQDRWTNPGMEGSLHGGIVCSVLDTVMGFALMATVASSEVDSGPTVNLNVNFLAAADEDIAAVGTVERVGSSTAVVDGELSAAGSDETIATAQGVWRVYEE